MHQPQLTGSMQLRIPMSAEVIANNMHSNGAYLNSSLIQSASRHLIPTPKCYPCWSYNELSPKTYKDKQNKLNLMGCHTIKEMDLKNVWEHFGTWKFSCLWVQQIKKCSTYETCWMTSSFVIIRNKKYFQKVQQCLYQQYVVQVSLYKGAVTVY